MKTRLILAAALLLSLTGCNMMNCGAETANGAGAADCGLHTTFLGVRSHAARPLASTQHFDASTKS